MKDFKIKNEEGLELTITQSEIKDYEPIMGGDATNPTWEKYLYSFNKELQPHLKLIRKAIEELEWIGKTGEEISNNYTFVFSDGQAWGFSWRAWGDLMQAIVDKQEGYMMYYM